jgi:beta-glucosidase
MLKHKDLIEKMTLEEKASLLSGGNFWNTKPIERLGIPSIMLTDGPHGLRKQGGAADNLGLNASIPATCFPTAATLANSWDVDMLAEVGRTLAKECLKEQVSVILGPGLNIKRNPLCGRNFEYFSEDPYLAGKLAASMIRGIEGMGVTACAKHFAVNSQEHLRMSMDELVDERALRELYLEGFRYAVTEGKPGALMSSYNKVNGTHANENHHLLKDILVNEWGFDGVIVTDWGGNNDRVAGLVAGNHLEMPSSGGVTDQEVVEAVRNGVISEDLVNERVDRLLSPIFKSEKNKKQVEVDYEAHHQKAIEFAQQSMVLLKNDENILPLKAGQRIAVIGDFAQTPRYQGAGSSLIAPTRLDNAYEAILRRNLSIVGYAQGFKRYGGKSESLAREAAALAGQADVALLFLGLDEGSEAEGVDRADMKLRVEQLDLVERIRQVNPNLVVILSGGAPVELPFEPRVKAILHGYLGGQGSGEAVAALLTGEAVPSGKLAETYPLVYGDVPSANDYPGRERTSEHRESIFIGYRYFDTAKKAVRYPFGFGLSYTTFEYSNLRVDGNSVTFQIKNTGTVTGAEIAQVYIHKKGSVVFRAEQELKGFQKKWIAPGETQIFEIELDEHAFAFYHVGERRWVVEPGEYEIRVGASSRDIRLTGLVTLAGEPVESPYDAQAIAPYMKGDVEHVSSADFAKLYGKPLPAPLWDRNADLGMRDSVAQGRYKRWPGRFLAWLMTAFRQYYLWKNQPISANNVYFIQNLRFEQAYRFSMGQVKKSTIENLLILINKGLVNGAMTIFRKKNGKS